jgi:hypothetical protein
LKSRRFGRERLAGRPARASSRRGLLIPRYQAPGQESRAVSTHGDMEKAHGTAGVQWLPKAKEIRKEAGAPLRDVLIRG